MKRTAGNYRPGAEYRNALWADILPGLYEELQRKPGGGTLEDAAAMAAEAGLLSDGVAVTERERLILTRLWRAYGEEDGKQRVDASPGDGSGEWWEEFVKRLAPEHTDKGWAKGNKPWRI